MVDALMVDQFPPAQDLRSGKNDAPKGGNIHQEEAMARSSSFISAALMLVVLSVSAAAEDASPGVTAKEIKVGATFPFSGPASQLGNTGKSLSAYISMINDRGGINGRTVKLITLDDGFSPPKAVEQVRRLVESEEVALIIGSLGTSTNTATAKYLNAKKVPSLFIVAGATKFENYKDYPYTTTGLPSYNTEGKMYAKYLTETAPNAKVAILYQNDDLGKDFVLAFKEYLKDDFEKRVVTASYEVSEPTIDSQIVKLRGAGAEALLVAGTPKFAAQALRRASEIDWHPIRIVNHISGSIPALRLAGLDKAVGVVTAAYSKSPSDPAWREDEGMKWYRTFFEKYLPGSDFEDGSYLTGANEGMLLEQVLKQCGDDLSRENITRQARNLRDFILPTALPGIKINTSETNNRAWTQLQLQRWDGARWERFGSVLNADSH
jgi:ABC-type branched-subunit amino acid transport system substrate-binding protein